MYKVIYRLDADTDLEKLDKPTVKRIIAKVRWLSKNIENLTPEMLSGEYSGLFKLRVGDWRVIYDINYPAKTIIVYTIGHRKEIYK